MKEKRTMNLIYNKDGHGSMTTKISVPKKWADDMGFKVDDREAELVYDFEKKEITIKKKEGEE